MRVRQRSTGHPRSPSTSPAPKKGEDWHLNKLSVTLCFTYCSCCKRAVLQRSACPHSVSACAVKPLARADVMSPLFALVDLSNPKTLQTRRAVDAEVWVRANRLPFRGIFARVSLATSLRSQWKAAAARGKAYVVICES